MTTRHFIEADGSYVVHIDGLPEGLGYIEVPPRPEPSFVWVDGAWASPDPTLALVAWRTSAQCSRLQGRLTLGAAVCAALDTMAADPATPWAMRETITGATEWRRSSQTIDELGYLLGYDTTQMDALFEAAMRVAV